MKFNTDSQAKNDLSREAESEREEGDEWWTAIACVFAVIRQLIQVIKEQDNNITETDSELRLLLITQSPWIQQKYEEIKKPEQWRK